MDGREHDDGDIAEVGLLPPAEVPDDVEPLRRMWHHDIQNDQLRALGVCLSQPL